MKIGRLVILNVDIEDNQGQDRIVPTILRFGIIKALNESAGRLLGPPHSTDKTTLIIKLSQSEIAFSSP